MVMSVMIMMVMMSTSAFLTIVMMVMFVLLLIVMMVMMLMFLILIMVMVMMFVFFLVGCHLCKFLCQGAAMFHCGHKLIAGKILPRSGYDLCVRVEFFQHLNRSHEFFLFDSRGAAERNHICILNLIVEELSEIADVHLALGGIDYRDLCTHFSMISNAGHRLGDIR